MDRRKFIKMNVIAGTIGTITGTSLYGTPGSLSEEIARNHLNASKLILPLSKLKVPEGAIAPLSKYGAIWHNLLNSKAESSLFSKNPNKYFENHGLSTDLIEDDSIEFTLLKAFASEKIQKAAQTQQPKIFIESLINHGIIREGLVKSKLKNQVLHLMEEESEHFKKITKKIQDKFSNLDIENIEEREMDVIISELSALGSETKAFVIAAVVVIIAAAVLIYVSVGAAVTVGLTAAVEVSVALHQAVVVSTGTSINSSEKSSKSSGNLIEALDPEKAQSYSIASEIALLTGNKELLKELDDMVFREEVTSVFSALEEADLIKVEKDSLANVVDALSSMRLKSFIA